VIPILKLVEAIIASGSAMPELSRFFGISIRMYYDDHNPPHFHAIYGGAEAEVGLDPVALLRGGSHDAHLYGNGMGSVAST